MGQIETTSKSWKQSQSKFVTDFFLFQLRGGMYIPRAAWGALLLLNSPKAHSALFPQLVFACALRAPTQTPYFQPSQIVVLACNTIETPAAKVPKQIPTLLTCLPDVLANQKRWAQYRLTIHSWTSLERVMVNVSPHFLTVLWNVNDIVVPLALYLQTTNDHIQL